MELRHLRYFVAVAEERNFNRAAERLHISQPPLSRQIRQLEDSLGVELLVRGSRPLELTRAGQFFYDRTVQFLAHGIELENMTRRIAEARRSLTVGFVASTLYGILPRMIRRFRASHPEIALQLLEMTSLEQLQALKEGKIDLGFGRIRYESPGIRRITLRNEPLMAALVADHPLSGRPFLTLKELQPEPLLLYPQAPHPNFADQVLALFQEASLEPYSVITVRELQVALGLVAAGEGIALVPECMSSLRRNEVVFKTLSEPQMVSPIIISIRQFDRSADIRALLHMIYQLCDEEAIPYLEPLPAHWEEEK